MKLAHQIKVKVFSYEKRNEDEKLILDKFLQYFPFNFKDEKIELNKKETPGFNEQKITILEAILIKEKHTRQFLENLNEKLLGGFKIEVNNELIDLTLKNKIYRLQEHLIRSYE